MVCQENIANEEDFISTLYPHERKILTAWKDGFMKGFIEGFQKGFEEGRRLERESIAKKL